MAYEVNVKLSSIDMLRAGRMAAVAKLQEIYAHNRVEYQNLKEVITGLRKEYLDNEQMAKILEKDEVPRFFAEQESLKSRIEVLEDELDRRQKSDGVFLCIKQLKNVNTRLTELGYDPINYLRYNSEPETFYKH